MIMFAIVAAMLSNHCTYTESPRLLSIQTASAHIRRVHSSADWPCRFHYCSRLIAGSGRTARSRRMNYNVFVSCMGSLNGDFVLFFSRPRSEGWSHHGRTFSIYLCNVPCLSVILIDSSTGRPVHVLMLSIQAVRGLFSSPACTWHCSLHYLFLQTTSWPYILVSLLW